MKTPHSHVIDRFDRRRASTVAAACMALWASSGSHDATAQTCAAPIAIVADTTYTGSTCDGEHVADTFCGDVPNPGPNTVFRFTVWVPLAGQFTLTAQSGAFLPVMFLMDGASPCDSAPCLATGDTSTPIALGGLGPGEYWLIIAAPPDASPGACGEFMLTNDATEVDAIFADGFE